MTNLHNFTRGAKLNDYVRDRLRPLDDDAIRAVAPSVYALDKHASRSDRYAYIPTVNVLNALRREGFDVVEAQQSKARTLDRREFTKHLLKFSRVEARDIRVGEALPQVVLINAHDGTSAYKLYIGIFRFVCSNGLIVCDGEFDSISVPHVGNVVDKVIDASYEVIDQGTKTTERVLDWQKLLLTGPEQNAFAEAALELRYDTAKKPAPTTAAELLKPHRAEDIGDDLWKTFNRVEENLVGGGQRYRTRNGRRAQTRAVKGIDSNTGLNRALWKLADQLKAIKAAA